MYTWTFSKLLELNPAPLSLFLCLSHRQLYNHKHTLEKHTLIVLKWGLLWKGTETSCRKSANNRTTLQSSLFIYLSSFPSSAGILLRLCGTNDLTQWATSPNSGWPELDGLVSFVLHWDGKTGWKKNIFTTEAALIMPGPHRGPFCLLTWATINTSSIQYNSPCSIIKSLDGPLTGLRLIW